MTHADHTDPQRSPYADIEDLSRQFLIHFYQHDPEWCLPHCDPRVSYLGSTLHGFAVGIESLRTVMTTVLDRFFPSLPVSIETRVNVLPGNQAIMVLAKFFLVSDPSIGDVRASRKRGTLIWVLTDNGPRLHHLHVSTPMLATDSGDVPPENLQETYQYAKVLLNNVIRRTSVNLRDVDGVLHCVAPAEVRAIEASRQHCMVHCLDHTILVRRGFGDLTRHFADHLVVVHRSYAVNPAYVRTVSASAVVLDDGMRVPLPQRRSREIRTRLEEAIRLSAEAYKLHEMSPLAAPPSTGDRPTDPDA